MKGFLNLAHVLHFFVIIAGSCVYGADLKLGIENASQLLKYTYNKKKIMQCKVGFITNHTSKDQSGNRSVDILLQHGLTISYLLAPEHGFYGVVAAGKDITNTVDKKTGIKIVSLYDQHAKREVSPEIMKSIDVLMFDVQDVGMRHYTYIATMFYAMRSAAQHNKPFVVFDRPNPLGYRIEGPIIDEVIPGSMIAAVPIPLRHGMTVGELAQFFNRHILHNAVQLHVIKMQNYTRFNTPDNLLKNLSPNITSAQSCYGYSFLGLLGEVRPFDVGVGTEMPFCRIGLSEKYAVTQDVWKSLHSVLQTQGIQSHIKDYTRRNQKFHGVTFSINNIQQVASFELLLKVLSLFKQAGVPLQFSEYFDRAVGTPYVRQYIEGSLGRIALAQVINNRMYKFLTQARSAYLYAPIPQYTQMN
ncbi:MAG TPA: DUF1343 domain-containing protein [Candidatus Dependentiae bacterium]|nr:DUF1343 domain-containing protein [Candidatus Dependentiae bacterium]HRQ62838.1 DUF1343 domain-containing protein [Candidatus Dependentiae bacterium]